jgi:hypothetical protein
MCYFDFFLWKKIKNSPLGTLLTQVADNTEGEVYTRAILPAHY